MYVFSLPTQLTITVNGEIAGPTVPQNNSLIKLSETWRALILLLSHNSLVLSISYIFNLSACFSLFSSRNPNNSTTNSSMVCPLCVTRRLREPLSQPGLPVAGGSSGSPALLPDHGLWLPARPLLLCSSSQVEVLCHFVLVCKETPN